MSDREKILHNLNFFRSMQGLFNGDDKRLDRIRAELTRLWAIEDERAEELRLLEAEYAPMGALLAEIQRRAFTLDLGDKGDETAADLYAYYQQQREKVRRIALNAGKDTP